MNRPRRRFEDSVVASPDDIPRLAWCPYPGCRVNGTDDEVDEHRSNNHREEAQQGSNLKRRPRDRR